jgi:hypothetical protein
VLKKPISKTHPNLLKEWYYKKNVLSPDILTSGSDKKVWWKCLNNPDHTWEASISHRVNGRGCPYCAGRKVNWSNCLANLHPEISIELHVSKNNGLTGKDIYAGGTKEFWWQCQKHNDHIWKADVRHRLRGQGCPYCSGRRVSKQNNFEAKFPKLAKEWDVQKNKNFLPQDFSYGSAAKIWWNCPKSKNHSYQMSIANRANGQGCPYCAGKKIANDNSLGENYPMLVDEWDFQKNKITPFQITPSHDKKVWWICRKNKLHKWQAPPYSRIKGSDCPICNGKIVINETSLKYNYPQIAKEWHPSKNSLTAFDVHKSSLKEAWWRCSKNNEHEWKTRVVERTVGGTNCPFCSNKKTNHTNCLSTTHPELLKEWDYTLNTKFSPDKVNPGSHLKVNWICKRNPSHKWATAINLRTKNNFGCPFCKVHSQSIQELTISFELKTIFNGIDARGHKIKIGNKIFSTDIFIKELQLAIEFDGSYWHKESHTKDHAKTKALISEGLDVIRIREKPLKALSENDICVEKKYNPKNLVNLILLQIKNKYKLDRQTNTRINQYIEIVELKGKVNLERYLDEKLKK